MDVRDDQSADRQVSVSTETCVMGKPPRNLGKTPVATPSSMAYPRVINNIPCLLAVSPEGEPGGLSSNGKMCVSTNSLPGEEFSTVESSLTSSGTSDGIWNKNRNTYFSSNDPFESSLLEALKMRGYRNVMSQRFQNEQIPRELRQEQAFKNPSNQTQSEEMMQQEVKMCSSDTESNACSFDIKSEDFASEEEAVGISVLPQTLKKSREQVSDETIAPDSLDAYKERLMDYIPKNYEEESVSERIRRKSYFIRFNDDRPKRRPSCRDSDLIPDYRSGLWSRFSVDDDPIGVTRRSNRGRNRTSENRFSANLDDYLGENSTRRKDSSSSYNHDDLLSDDGLWGTYGSSTKPGYMNGHTATFDSMWYDRPGSLWTQRGRPKTEQSVLDTVPDLEQRRWTSRNSYGSSVTAKSPVQSHQNLLSSAQRRSSLNDGEERAPSEEGDSKSMDSDDSQKTLDANSDEIIDKETELLCHFTQD